MIAVVGVFQSTEDAYAAVGKLQSQGLKNDKINLLVPGDPKREVRKIPTTESEQPGMGAALGGVMGGAAGAATGLGLGEIAASMFLPGVGPIIAFGLVGAAIVGAISAAGGVAIGDAVEKKLDQGLPVDEIYVYEDALRKGRSVVVTLAENEAQADDVRELLAQAGAESIDAAREQWWIGLREVERESYTAQGLDFSKDELNYRRGFEAVQHQKARGKFYSEAGAYLASRYPEIYLEESFRYGFERGQVYYKRQMIKS